MDENEWLVIDFVNLTFFVVEMRDLTVITNFGTFQFCITIDITSNGVFPRMGFFKLIIWPIDEIVHAFRFEPISAEFYA